MSDPSKDIHIEGGEKISRLSLMEEAIHQELSIWGILLFFKISSSSFPCHLTFSFLLLLLFPCMHTHPSPHNSSLPLFHCNYNYHYKHAPRYGTRNAATKTLFNPLLMSSFALLSLLVFNLAFYDNFHPEFHRHLIIFDLLFILRFSFSMIGCLFNLLKRFFDHLLVLSRGENMTTSSLEITTPFIHRHIQAMC